MRSGVSKYKEMGCVFLTLKDCELIEPLVTFKTSGKLRCGRTRVSELSLPRKRLSFQLFIKWNTHNEGVGGHEDI